MQIIRNTEQMRMPWKNGGGETIEVCRAPVHSTLDSFDWRISRARIDRSGPFSPFPGIDRTIVAIDGAGILLSLGDAEPVTLRPGDPPLYFSGETPVDSAMIAGPVSELNVMTRRQNFRHQLTVFASGLRCDTAAHDGAISVIFAAGPAVIDTVAGKTRLSAGDAAMAYAADGTVGVTPESGAKVFLVRIEPLRA